MNDDEKNKFIANLADRIPLADYVGKQVILDGRRLTITEYKGDQPGNWQDKPTD